MKPSRPPPGSRLNRRQVLLAGAATSLVAETVMSGSAGPTSEPGGRTLDVWPQGAPGAGDVKVQEQVIERLPDGPMRDRFVQNVTRPLLTLFTPARDWNGITLLVVPGGGYVRVVIDKEGFEAADWFTQRGFAVAVLRYRMPADGWVAGADAPVHDAMRAVRLLRGQRLPMGAAARSIGIMGFSAGGHLCARLITEPGLQYPRQDTIDDESARPDFAVLMYPVIATTGAWAHAGSANQLKLGGVEESDLNRYSPDRNVDARTPRTLLIHASDDSSVPVENSLRMFEALRKARVRSELHVFDAGGHGFGLRGVAGKDVAIWPTLVQNWARNDAN